MTIRIGWKVGFASLATMLVAVACGSNNSNTTATSSAAHTTATTGVGGSAATSTGAGGMATLDCNSYCGEVMANCTGANAQYGSNDSCMGFCKTFTAGMLGMTSGDTLGCRIYHGGGPAKMNATLHCPHAGPSGGSVTPGMAGTCTMDPCTDFCTAAVAVCAPGGTPVAMGDWKDVPSCMTDCSKFTAGMGTFNTGDTSGNSFACRLYHLTAASANAAAAMTHCAHILAMSPTCM